MFLKSAILQAMFYLHRELLRSVNICIRDTCPRRRWKGANDLEWFGNDSLPRSWCTFDSCLYL